MNILINIRPCIFPLLLVFAVPGLAEPDTPEGESNPDQVEYLTQDQMTDEDYTRLSEGAAKYDACLNEKSARELQNYDDPRHVVDTAMKQCAIVLDELNNWMIFRKIPPGFANRYMQKTVNRSVNKLLPRVMMQTAARQSAAEQQENNQ